MRTTTLLLTGLFLCLTDAPSAAADLPAALSELADVCTAQHDYDPRQPGAIAETALADGERAWRACMYAGIGDTIVPSSPAPDAWRALIAADRAMTDAIATGTLTRSQRAARLQMLIADIRLAEFAETESRLRDTQQQLEFRDRIEQIRREVPRFF